jgi:hypothetical protein
MRVTVRISPSSIRDAIPFNLEGRAEKGTPSAKPRRGLAQTDLSPEYVAADFGDSEAIGIQGTQ